MNQRSTECELDADTADSMGRRVLRGFTLHSTADIHGVPYEDARRAVVSETGTLAPVDGDRKTLIRNEFRETGLTRLDLAKKYGHALEDVVRATEDLNPEFEVELGPDVAFELNHAMEALDKIAEASEPSDRDRWSTKRVLTDREARLMRFDRAMGATLQECADKYGCAVYTASQVSRHLTYKEAGGPKVVGQSDGDFKVDASDIRFEEALRIASQAGPEERTPLRTAFGQPVEAVLEGYFTDGPVPADEDIVWVSGDVFAKGEDLSFDVPFVDDPLPLSATTEILESIGRLDVVDEALTGGRGSLPFRWGAIKASICKPSAEAMVGYLYGPGNFDSIRDV